MPAPELQNEPTFNTEKYRYLRQRLYLDLLQIDEEIQDMPSLIQDAGEMSAMAIEIREAAEHDLKVISAQVAEHLRNTNGPDGKKRSETAIISQLPLSPELNQAQAELSRSRLDASLWSYMVDALRKKDGQIRTVADLLNSGYLTSSSILSKRRKELRDHQQV